MFQARPRDIRDKGEEGQQGQDRLWATLTAGLQAQQGSGHTGGKADAQIWGLHT